MAQRIFQLEKDWFEFPNPELASSSPNGLLAIGGDLSVRRLVTAYRSGIFPWFGEEEPILWWSPNPRGILELDELKISKSLAKFIRRNQFTVTVNSAFSQVIEHCAYTKRLSPSDEDSGTWITEEMIAAYINLHEHGYAHSIEVWLNEQLVGGLYGIGIGKIFCGESMFHKHTNASKVAFVWLVQHLQRNNFDCIDCQLQNPHLQSLGAKEVSRTPFLERLHNNRDKPVDLNCWKTQTLIHGKSTH